MTSQDSLIALVEKLERQNRRMKLIGIGSLVMAGAILLMGQTSGPRTQDEVRAKSFVLVDAKGETRALLFMAPDGPGLQLYDKNGTPRLDLDASSDGPRLELDYANGKTGASLTSSELLNGTTLDMVYVTRKKAGVALTALVNGPLINVEDAQGFKTGIGATNLVTVATGETHRTSAASITLFGKDEKVLWSAP